MSAEGFAAGQPHPREEEMEDVSSKRQRTEADEGTKFVKLRGLPWNTSAADVCTFLVGANVVVDNVALLRNDRGECLVRLPGGDASVEAAKRMHKQHFGGGKRYIEVFEATRQEMDDAQVRLAETADADYKGVVRMQGLPWGATPQDVISFFASVAAVKEEHIHLIKKNDGRFSGNGFVIFDSEEIAAEALKLNKEKMQGRWIDLHQGTKAEIYSLSAPTPGAAGGNEAGGGSALSDLGDVGVVRMRGMPYNTTAAQITDFFSGLQIAKDGIHLINGPDGRPAGQAYVVFESPAEAESAMKKDKALIGSRYVDLFLSDKAELMARVGPAMAAQHRAGADLGNVGVVRMRGMPFNTTASQIQDFFSGFKFVPNQIHLVHGPDGRLTGQAFVAFESPEEAQAAMKKDRESIGTRYVELFLSDKGEMASQVGTPMGMPAGMGGMGMVGASAMAMGATGHYGVAMGGGLGGYQAPLGDVGVLRMRGMPYYTTKEQIKDFFSGRRIVPDGIHLLHGSDGRLSGQAYVVFESPAEAQEGLKKDKETIGSRYVDIFISSKDELQQKVPSFNAGGHGDPYAAYQAPMGMYGMPPPRGGTAPMDGSSQNCVRMRGLPYDSSQQDIRDFFAPLNPINIQVVYNTQGRPSGHAYAEFSTLEEVQSALLKHKATLGSRFVEVFACSQNEMNMAVNPQAAQASAASAAMGAYGMHDPNAYAAMGAYGYPQYSAADYAAAGYQMH